MKCDDSSDGSKIVIVDDDSDLLELLAQLFAEDGHRVATQTDGKGLIDYLETEGADILILDVMIPGEDGLSLCKRIRAAKHDLPIIMLTARDDETDRVIGLELGADDYVLKPFSGMELKARVRAALRRAEGRVVVAPASPLQFSLPGWTFRPAEMELTADDGLSVALSSAEADLLHVFVRNAAVPLSRKQLMELTGRFHSSEDGRSIDTLVSRLRRKLARRHGKDELIKTVWGRGYLLAATPKSQ